MNKLSIRDIPVRGKRVLVRVDFNVPTEERDGRIEITDDTRIRESLPTINYLREHGAKIILMAHFGRPKGKAVDKYSLRPVADHLHKLINHPVAFSRQTVGPEAEQIIADMKDGDVTLLENVRFQAEEEANDASFAQQLARLGDVFVNDAFGAAHRAHASTAGVTRFVGQSAMGFLMQKELKYLQGELERPAKPFVVIMGGAKVSDKIGVIKSLMTRADTILIGGAMANTFWKAKGTPVGASKVEADKLDLALELIEHAKKSGVKLMLPVDALETEEFKAGARKRNTGKVDEGHGVTDGWQAVDIGQATIALYKEEIARAKTILWNGPVGVFEFPNFAKGTEAVAKAIAANTGFSIAGGGETITAIEKYGIEKDISYISTGGGAFLEFVQGDILPAVAILQERARKK